MKISSAKAKRPEIRVIKFKRTPKKSKSKIDNNEENLSAIKTNPSKANKQKDFSNKETLKKNLRTKLTDSSLTKSMKLNSFNSIFNTAPKGKIFLYINLPINILFLRILILNFQIIQELEIIYLMLIIIKINQR